MPAFARDPLGGCEECQHMRPGSCFDGKHLYCERFEVWTNLLEPEWRGHCLDPERKAKAEPKQLSLF